MTTINPFYHPHVPTEGVLADLLDDAITAGWAFAYAHPDGDHPHGTGDRWVVGLRPPWGFESGLPKPPYETSSAPTLRVALFRALKMAGLL